MEVTMPQGGQGNMKTETSAGVEDLLVLEDTTTVHDTHTLGRDNAIVEASPNCGKVHADAQFHDRLLLADPRRNTKV